MIGFLILLFCAISFLNSALLVVKTLFSILRAGLRPVRKPTQPAVSGLSPPGTAKKWVLAERKPHPPASGSEPPPGTPSGDCGPAAEVSCGAGRGARRRRPADSARRTRQEKEGWGSYLADARVGWVGREDR